MAESFDTVAVVAGGLTALGVVLDWGVAPQTKQRLQTKLESLLYRFHYTTLRTFGRDEIAFSVRVFDLFGQRFFSWRRVAVVGLFYASITIICGINMSLDGPDSDWRVLLVRWVLSFLLFSCSISFTIWACRAMLRWPGGATLGGSIILLLVHLFLLSVWGTVLVLVGDGVAALMLGGIDMKWWGMAAFRAFLATLRSGPFGHYVYPILDLFSGNTGPQHVVFAVESIAALTANGLRIGLAILFFAGFIYVGVVRPALV